MLDAGAQHPGRTGRETLTLAAIMAGRDRRAVGAALERVGLTAREAERRVGNYSLGMRQRLGLAGALVGDPQVLVLDEPANGLDPAGIRWMRGLLRDFAADGGTVLLSSHLLHEVEQIAQDLVLIGRGRIVAQGSKDELLQHGGTIADSPDRARLGTVLEAAGLEVGRRPEGGLLVAADAEQVAKIALAEQVLVTELRTAGGGGLEEMFLQLTADDARDQLTPGQAA